MKGIILAGGTGSRLAPLTTCISKHLLPVFNKPLIYYPLSILMLGGIRDILIITNEAHQDHYKQTLGDGSEFGINLSYKIQANPNGIAEAFVLGADFIQDDSVTLILGDNIFWGHAFSVLIKKAISKNRGATIFGCQVKDPKRFGVIEYDENQRVVSIEEKPKVPKSDFAATGLYIYDNRVVTLAQTLKASNRGELEITDLNIKYLELDAIDVELLGRGFVWLDAGTVESLFDASCFIQMIEERQGFKVSCIEEIAFKNGWISASSVIARAEKLKNTNYGDYLLELVKE